jgi:RNA polymerase primary sigma factor
MMNKLRPGQSHINRASPIAIPVIAIACLTVRLATALLVVQGMTTVVNHRNTPAHTTINSSVLLSSRIRTRTSLLCLGATTTTTTTTTTKSSTVRSKQQKRRRQQQPQTYYDYDDTNDDDDDDDEDDEILSSLAFEVDSFQELQRSTGSEILDDTLQKQIDDTNVNSFLDKHVTDASYLEKVAMSSIPEQLPQPAVNAFRHRQQQQQQQQQQLKEKKKKAKIVNNKGDRRETHGIEFAPSSKRVNPEEEIELAKMIQRGVWLHKLKTDKETEKGSSISKNEWATIANLDSTTQLRREVTTYRRAKQLLVSANMGLVNAVVKKQYYNVQKRDALSYEELIQEGSLGLIRAAELFDPSRGIRFSTYATIWIKGSLSHSHILDGSITLPAREKTKWNKIVKAHQDIIKEKGGFSDGTTNNNNEGLASGVSVQDIANRLDMNVEEVMTIQSKMNSAKKVLSLDYEYQAQTRGGGGNEGRGGQQLLMDMDKNFQADADLAERTQLQADIIAAMVRNLSPREARLIRLRYGLTTDGRTHTVQECADAMGVSQTRASQLAAKCLKKLREAAEADSLEEYLLTIA